MDVSQSAEFKLQTLQKVGIFHALQDNALRYLSDLFRIEKYQDKSAIISEGAPSAGLFVVTQGYVHVLRSGDQEGEIVFLTTLGEGSLFGEAALFPELRRTATIRASGGVEVLMIRREDLLQFFDNFPDAARQVLMQMLRDVFTKLQNTTFELRTQRSGGMTQSAIDQLFS